MKRENRLLYIIKEGLLDTFFIWKEEMKNVFKDSGVMIFFFLVPFVYPLLYAFIYNNEVVHKAKMVVVDQSDSYLSREFIRRVNATPDVQVVAVCTDMEEAKKMLDEAGFTDAVISASNDLDETLINSLKIQGATINSWGVGTNLITSKDCPSFGGVYKLAAIQDKKTGKFIPKIKLSENAEKITNPGDKTIQRIYSKETGKIIADLICLNHEKYSSTNSLLLFDPIETWKKTHLAPNSYTLRELLVPVFKNGLVSTFIVRTVPVGIVSSRRIRIVYVIGSVSS